MQTDIIAVMGATGDTAKKITEALLKADLLANTRDNRRNCRLIHMLGHD